MQRSRPLMGMAGGSKIRSWSLPEDEELDERSNEQDDGKLPQQKSLSE
jgi:hypothetical protein